MSNTSIHDHFIKILEHELVPALGCTEPIAVAYAAAKARQVLGEMPSEIVIQCSGNIIKNVNSVTVPNSNGLKGIEAAAILGVVGGNPDSGLEVLKEITDADREAAHRLLQQKICSTKILHRKENLHIIASLKSSEHEALVEIQTEHTHITRIEKDGRVLYRSNGDLKKGTSSIDYSQLSIKSIVAFANTVDLASVQLILENQIRMNLAISDEGLRNKWGVNVGKTLIEEFGDDVRTRAKARASAGSDARMSGCALPVVINSGSGNQGMTVSLPVIEYALELKVDKELLYRALIISNLVSIHQKHQIGRLSAYCGAVSAAAGCGAGIAYLHGFGIEEISKTIINTIANVGGIICDGAKPSCAAKIASSVDAAIMAFEMSRKNRVFASGDGLVKSDIEQTIESVGRMGRVGMKETDSEILRIMLDKSE